MTSVVFPAARFKFFLDAEPEARARRRFLEVREKGRPDVSGSYVLEELAVRERLDSTRKDAPLTRTAAAHYLDSTVLGAESVVEQMLVVIRAAGRA